MQLTAYVSWSFFYSSPHRALGDGHVCAIPLVPLPFPTPHQKLRTLSFVFPPYAEPAEKGTGWTFSPPEAAAMLRAVDAALETRWHRPDEWQAIMRNGMTADLSWNRAALQYEQIFNWALMDAPVRAY